MPIDAPPLELAAQIEGAQCRVNAHYPGVEWEVQAAQADHADAIAALEAYAFPPELDWADPERKGARTDGLLIVHHGVIIYERYGHGYTASTPHLAWSATKTFNAALIGIAAGEGLLDIQASVCEYLPGVPEENCVIRVVDLLEFASGLDWHETYEGSSPTSSSVLAMLYGEGRGDMASFTLSHPRRDPPGVTFQYSSGDSNALSAIARKALEPKYGERFPWVKLLDPIGMRGVTWERDALGTYIGSSYLYATARDYARFGLLLREDGCWNGAPLLPDGWVDASAEVSVADRTKLIDADPEDVQGRQLWLNRTVPERGLNERPWPHVPEDAISALGHWGQAIVAIPSVDLVVVRTADDRDGSFSKDQLLALAMAVAGEGPLPPPLQPKPPAPPAPPGEELPPYRASLFSLAAAFNAKETCSCRYVLGMDEDFCREVTRVSPDVANAHPRDDEKVVVSRTLGLWSAKARWVSQEEGCVLE